MKKLSIDNYKLIIFDFDGTLCHSKPAIIHSICKTYLSFGHIEPVKQTVTQLISQGIGLVDTFMALSPNILTHDTLDIWIDRYRNIYNQEGYLHSTLYDGVIEVFQCLKAQDIRAVIISNKGVMAINAFLERHAINTYIDFVIGDQADIEKKPAPMSFEKKINPVSPTLTKNQILMMSDTNADIEYAHNCGIDCALATYGYGNYDNSFKLKPTYIIGLVKELIT